MAPMFLVSNVKMLVAASKSGITGAIPALNFRTIELFEAALLTLKEKCEGPFGVNLIVNKSNFYYKDQLKACCKHKVDYIITSLGSPEETINEAHKVGVKVFCDVVNLDYAKKVEGLGADAIIAVNKEGNSLLKKPGVFASFETQNYTKGMESELGGGISDLKNLVDLKSTRLNSSHTDISRMPSSA